MMRYLKDEEPIRILFLIFLFFIFYNFILQPLGFLKVSALRTNDFFSNLSRSKKILPEEIKDIVIVTIGNDSLKQVGLQWPWRRSDFARLVNRISADGPRVIFLDHTFLGKTSDEASDLLFVEAIKNAGNVILAGYIDEEGEYVKPLDIFLSASQGIGLVNKISDSRDLRVRNIRAVFSLTKTQGYDYGAEVKILALASGIPLADIRYLSDKIILSPQLSIPVDSFGNIPINYSAAIDDFVSIPAYKLLNSELQLEPSVFKDKIVMVGATANIIHDIHHTPLGRMPGVYVNSNVLLMMLSGNFLKTLPFAYENSYIFLLLLSGKVLETLPYWYSIFIFLTFSLAMGFLSLRLKALYSALILTGVILALSLSYTYLQAYYNFRMDIFSIIFLTTASYLTVEIYKYVTLIVRSEKLKALAIIDPATRIYTQRYFQLNVESALGESGRRQANFFCLLRINEFSEIANISAKGLSNILKMLGAMIKEHIGKNILLARYGEDTFSLCVWNIGRQKIDKLLSLVIEEISGHEFIVEDNALKLSVRIAAVNFPQEHIKSYSDLVLTSELMLKRIMPDTKVPLVVFDPKVDRIIRSGAPLEEAKSLPKDELGYVSLDLEARNKELEWAVEELKRHQKKIDQLYFETMHSLVKALEEKDQYSAGHSERVELYATVLAEGLNLPREDVEAIHKAAYLHDIGKIGLPDRVLHKKEKLDEEEFEFVKRHQADGAKILEGLPFFKEVVPYILHHHERYDGKGYPHGLSGDMIPKGAQIITIADSFDAMTTGRGYNKPLAIPEAIQELRKSSGQQFNPAYVNKFIELIEQKKIHAL